MPDETDILEYLRNEIDIHVRSGYRSETEVAEDLEGIFWDELLAQQPRKRKFFGLIKLTRPPEIAALLDEVHEQLRAQRKRESQWGDLTINDRIDRAFEDLRDLGIIALQDAGFTKTDGWEDIDDAKMDDYPDAWGGVYFHRQDVQAGVAGRGFFIGFGAFATGEAHKPESIRLAATTCEVLQSHDIPLEWDGTVDMRIKILPFQWQKRRCTAPPEPSSS